MSQNVLVNKINAKRVLNAMSHIGYTDKSAISDIVDNSVSAEASEVNIKIKTTHYKRKNKLQEILIIDNGKGMNEHELENCLALGSSSENYKKDSLSKFGMGLKSAGLSLGSRISVISKSKDSKDIKKIILDLESITTEYRLVKENPSEEERKLLQDFKSGTCIRIERLREDFPTCESIFEKLDYHMSEIYNVMLKNFNLKISLTAFSEEETFEERSIKPFDPLFEEECNKNGDLNPETWDGITPRWLLKKHSIEFKPNTVPIYITCTHLVHPPTMSLKKETLTQVEARKKYRIAAGRSKFFIYRNNRIIAHDSLDGLISRDQDYYAFRSKIELSTEHDEELMLDVKKSGVRFSEDMLDKVSEALEGCKKTSKAAWKKKSREWREAENKEKNEEKREEMLKVVDPYEKPSHDLSEAEIEKKEKIVEEVLRDEQIESISPELIHRGDMPSFEPGECEKNEEEKNKKIKYVTALEHDQVYVPYMVQNQMRINISKGHRLQTFLSNYLKEIPFEVQQAIEVLFLSLAYAENSVARNFTYDKLSDSKELSKLVLEISKELRQDFSLHLSKNLTRLQRVLDKDR